MSSTVPSSRISCVTRGPRGGHVEDTSLCHHVVDGDTPTADLRRITHHVVDGTVRRDEVHPQIGKDERLGEMGGRPAVGRRATSAGRAQRWVLAERHGQGERQHELDGSRWRRT